MAQDEKEDKGGKGGKPTLTPEQEAEMAAKKAARAEAKAKGGGAKGAGKGGKGKGGAASTLEVASERVKRTTPARLRKLYDAEIRGKLISEFKLANPMEAPRLTKIT